MPKKHNNVTIEVHLVHETHLAYRVRSVDTEQFAWVPKSAVEFLPTSDDGVIGELELSESLAKEKGLI